MNKRLRLRPCLAGPNQLLPYIAPPWSPGPSPCPAPSCGARPRVLEGLKWVRVRVLQVPALTLAS